MDRIQLKLTAKSQIKGNVGILFVISLIIAVVGGIACLILGLVPIVGELASTIIVSSAFNLSIAIIYINLAKGSAPKPADAFCGFNDFWSAFKVQFFMSLFTGLWSLLFVIPGIIKGISYSQAMYIVAENPGMSALEAINKSKRMMHGHKMEYFVLGLSFIGWSLLASLTFGILYIWLFPYMNATYVNFYNALKNEAPADAIPVASTVVEGE